MHPVELIGYLASALVFATFCVKAMTPLRLIAIASNIAFIAYGYLGQMAPILLLHAGLLPLNLWRLCQTRRFAAKPRRTTIEVGLSANFLRVRKMPRRRAGQRASSDRQRCLRPAGRPSGRMPPPDGAPRGPLL